MEQRQREQISIGRGEAERVDDHQRRGDDIRVGEHGAARNHVHRRGGDHREGVVSVDVHGRRRAIAIETRQRREARRRRGLAELVPVCHAALGAGPLPDDGKGRRVRHHHRGRGALEHALDLLRGEPPVDRIRDDALARARAVEVDVRRVVLGEDADAIALGQSEPRQPGGEPVDSLQELAEGPLPRSLDQRRRVAVQRRAARQQVVDRERPGAHPLTGRRCPPSSARACRAARSCPSGRPCSCRAPSPDSRRSRSTRRR